MAKIQENSKEIAQLLVREQGKPFTEAMGELHHFLRDELLCGPREQDRGGVRQPAHPALGLAYGMVIKADRRVRRDRALQLFPLTLMGTKVGPDARRGQHDRGQARQHTPLATLRVAELMQEAELPPGVLNVVTGPGKEVGEERSLPTLTSGGRPHRQHA